VLAAVTVASAQNFPHKPVEFVVFKSGAEAALSVLGGHVPFATENLNYEPIPRPLRNSLAVSALP
jgi:tripartite-type tricarboxylate transporter receptor subunit TctC